MDQALESVNSACQRAGLNLATGARACRAEQRWVGAFRNRREAEDGVELGHTSTAEVRYLGKRVKFTAPVEGTDRSTRADGELSRREPPGRRLAIRDELANELTEAEPAIPLAGPGADRRIEARPVTRVEHLDVSVVAASEGSGRHREG